MTNSICVTLTHALHRNNNKKGNVDDLQYILQVQILNPKLDLGHLLNSSIKIEQPKNTFLETVILYDLHTGPSSNVQ